MDESRNLLDFVLVQESDENRVLNANVSGSAWGGISDRHLLVAKYGRVMGIEEKGTVKVTTISFELWKKCNNYDGNHYDHEKNLKQKGEKVRREVFRSSL